MATSWRAVAAEHAALTSWRNGPLRTTVVRAVDAIAKVILGIIRLISEPTPVNTG